MILVALDFFKAFYTFCYKTFLNQHLNTVKRVDANCLRGRSFVEFRNEKQTSEAM